MKGIASQLRLRLDEIEQELRVVDRRRAELTDLAKAARLLMTDEERRLQPQLPLIVPSKDGRKVAHVGKTPLGRFILETLTDVYIDRNRLVESAKDNGIDFGGKNPGRAMHYALYGLKHNGYTQMRPPKDWALTAKGMEAKEQMLARRPPIASSVALPAVQPEAEPESSAAQVSA